LDVDPIEAAVVVGIYECYVDREMGLAAIAEMLNARAVPTPTSERRRGVRAWSDSERISRPVVRCRPTIYVADTTTLV